MELKELKKLVNDADMLNTAIENGDIEFEIRSPKVSDFISIKNLLSDGQNKYIQTAIDGFVKIRLDEIKEEINNGNNIV